MEKSDRTEAPVEGLEDYCHSPVFAMEAAGHTFTFYPDGADRLTALIDLIGASKQSIEMFYYLFAGDKAGTAVRDALVAAAQRGVKVHLIVDDFGNEAGNAFFELLIEAGGEFAVFSPRLSKYYFARNHQKMTIVDGVRVMTGGANVSDHYFHPPAKNGWCDMSVIIEGPVAEKFTEWFAILRSWTKAEAAGWISQLRSLRDIIKRWDGGEGPVRLLVGGPFARRGHWSWCLRQDLVGASRLDTVSAYFSPPRSFRRKFARIARSGTVRMIMPGKSDFSAAIDVARLLYRKLLKAGAQIFEFQPCKLHMKLLVVDDISYVGSANLDKRSFRINVELMVRIEDAALAGRLRELIDHMETASQPVSREWYARKATFLTRLRWRLAYLLSLADYRVSRISTG
jgi:cardiolipin synthase A/B